MQNTAKTKRWGTPANQAAETAPHSLSRVCVVESIRGIFDQRACGEPLAVAPKLRALSVNCRRSRCWWGAKTPISA